MKIMTNRALALVACVAWSAEGGVAQVDVPSGEQIAVEIEAAAMVLHDRLDRWADAATLYLAAAELRKADDPQAQKNLFTAANLLLHTGNVGGAIQALEAAGTRALASGAMGLARERFADAALVAQRAGLSREHQRLSYRTTEVAMATSVERGVPDRESLGAALPRR